MTQDEIPGFTRKIGDQYSHAVTLMTPRQRELFPLDTTIEFPGATTAESSGKAKCANDKVYYLKGDRGGSLARASEMFCVGLAEAVGLQCPPSEIIRVANGDWLFGSEEIVGVAEKTETSRILMSKADDASVAAGLGLQRFLSSAFAFDMMIHNVDRHDQNFLSVTIHGTRHFFLIDHAQSMFSCWPIKDFPPACCHTRATGAKLRLRHGFHLETACSMVERIDGLAPQTIMGLMQRIPQDWLRAGFDRDVERWWGSPAFKARLQRLREGLRDGSLL
jgi:hypothetical protein